MPRYTKFDLGTRETSRRENLNISNNNGLQSAKIVTLKFGEEVANRST
jgi:hypothetical protein